MNVKRFTEDQPAARQQSAASAADPASAAENPADPLDLRSALRVVQAAEHSARRSLDGNTALVYLIWGVTWIVGYGSLWAAQQELLPLEPAAALVILGAVLAAATLTTVIIFARSSTGVRGQSAFQGRMYGIAWALGFTVMGALSSQIGRAVDDFWLRGLLINSIAVLIVGLLYICGGTIFHDKAQSFLGIWLLLVTVAALAAGPQWFLAVFLFLGATGLLAGAVVETLRTRRQRNGSAHA